MDYFSRFKSRVEGPKYQWSTALRLYKFQEYWWIIQKSLECPRLSPDTKVAGLFKIMVDLLVQEEICIEEGTTGVCMEYLLKSQVLGKLADNAPNGIRQEVIRLISSMINLLDHKFLVHHAVHAPTLKILNACMSNEEWAEHFAEDLVDLMYNICSKIHGYPELLHIFFHDKQWLTVPQKLSTKRAQGLNKLFNPGLLANSLRKRETSSWCEKREYEFVFFKHLMVSIHKESKVGDIARAALLLLMDITDSGLRDFILSGDFCTIIAAGLGAFYSQLPRKLMIEVNMKCVPLRYDDFATENAQCDEISDSPEFQMLLESFLKYLDFTQEVLERCSSGSICNMLMENIKTLFLKNILYPSLLECSDTDGTAVAAITYLDLLIRNITNSELNSMIIAYLVNSDLTNLPTHNSSVHDRIPDGTANNQRFLGQTEVSSLLPYNMKDLIFSNLRSTSQSAVIAALKLLKTMLTRHCIYTLGFLDVEFTSIKEISIEEKRYTPVVDHFRVLNRYLSLIPLIDPSYEMRISIDSYGEYLVDAETSMEYHEQHHREDMTYINSTDRLRERKIKQHARRMSIRYSNLNVTKGLLSEQKPKEIAPGLLQNLGECNLYKHKRNSTDPIMHVLIGLLSGYFGQSCELNLAVTGALTAVISCPCRDLECWVSSKNETLALHSSHSYQCSPASCESIEQEEFNIRPPSLVYDDESSGEETASIIHDRIFSKSRLFEDPIFFAVLEELSNQVVRFRRETRGFDQRFRARQEELLALENLSAQKALYISKEKKMSFNVGEKSLGEVVDNALILCEVIKEVASIIQVRRSLGVNEVWYV